MYIYIYIFTYIHINIDIICNMYLCIYMKTGMIASVVPILLL